MLGGFCNQGLKLKHRETWTERLTLIARSGIMAVFFVEDLDEEDAVDKDETSAHVFKGFNASFRFVKNEQEKEQDESKVEANDASPNWVVLSSSSKLLSRFGHSLDSDSSGETLWLFGGVSHERGPLNDIRAFQIRTRSWHPVTLQTTNNVRSCTHDCLPTGRYFHAACLLQDRYLYVHGGTNGSFAKIFHDFWVFDKLESFWQPLLPIPDLLGGLAGHTLTSLEDREGLLVLVGGYSHENGGLASSKIYAYSPDSANWSLFAKLPKGKGVFGHTTVYNEETETIYIYGGEGPSNELRALHYPTKRWLSSRRQPVYFSLHVPHPRFLHAAVDNRNYMVVLGGNPDDTSLDRFISIYVYKCRLWINLKLVDFVGIDSQLEALSAAINFHSSSVYLAGGFSSSNNRILDDLIEFRLRPDYCDLFSADRHMCTGMLGCSHCSVFSGNGTNSTHCYFNDQEEFGVISEKCQNIESGTLEFNKGYPCRRERSREQFFEERVDNNRLEELSCARAKSREECRRSMTQSDCIWAKDGLCIQSNQNGMIKLGPTCQERMGCESCLDQTSGSQRGCLWSQKLTACLSPLSVPLLCAGGLCGHIYIESCPALCAKLTTCQECLTGGRATCGWCASMMDSGRR